MFKRVLKVAEVYLIRWGIFYHYRIYLFSYKLRKNNFMNNINGSKFQQLSSKYYKELYNFGGNYLKDLLKKPENLCFISQKKGVLSSYHLFTMNNIIDKFVLIKINKKEIGAPYGYVFKKFRNNDIYSNFPFYISNVLLKKGFIRIIGVINSNNFPAINSLSKFGFEDGLKSVRYIVLFRRWKFFIRNDSPERISFSRHKCF